ncbi:MAG: hypothetical protein AAB604_02525 [Patescibacteria group bacterium]
MLQKKILEQFKLSYGILLGIALAIGLSVLAFTEPSQAPPGCTPGTAGCDAPLNVGAAGQQKLGGLVLGVNCVLPDCTTGLIVQNGNVGIGTVSPGAKLDVQGGDINASGKIKESGNALIPSGFVGYFNLGVCPFGWSPLASGDGRYIVGRTSGGVGVTAGTALSSGEDRPVGQHNHTITDPGHNHGGSTGSGGNSPGGMAVQYSGGGTDIQGSHNHSIPTGGTNILVNNTGSVAGTNAPYLQLLVCQKD